jgi:hypothetical protein
MEFYSAIKKRRIMSSDRKQIEPEIMLCEINQIRKDEDSMSSLIRGTFEGKRRRT